MKWDNAWMLGWKNSCRLGRIYGASVDDSTDVGYKVKMNCNVWEGSRPVTALATATSLACFFFSIRDNGIVCLVLFAVNNSYECGKVRVIWQVHNLIIDPLLVVSPCLFQKTVCDRRMWKAVLESLLRYRDCLFTNWETQVRVISLASWLVVHSRMVCWNWQKGLIISAKNGSYEGSRIDLYRCWEKKGRKKGSQSIRD